MFYIDSKKSIGGIILIDISGFTQMKLKLDESEWLNIMQNFYNIANNIINSSKSVDVKLLGDGILMTSSSYLPNEWFSFIHEIYFKSMNWFISNSNEYVEGVSIVAGYGEYYSVNNKDVIGLDIDELFLIEKYGALNKVIVSEKLYNLLPIEQRNQFQKRMTNPIMYLNQLEINYYELNSI